MTRRACTLCHSRHAWRGRRHLQEAVRRKRGGIVSQGLTSRHTQCGSATEVPPAPHSFCRSQVNVYILSQPKPDINLQLGRLDAPLILSVDGCTLWRASTPCRGLLCARHANASGAPEALHFCRSDFDVFGALRTLVHFTMFSAPSSES